MRLPVPLRTQTRTLADHIPTVNLEMKKDSEKTQKQKFIEKAKELNCDETGKKFEDAFDKIVPPKEKADS